jgi:uncharacterized protein with GYD domain
MRAGPVGFLSVYEIFGDYDIIAIGRASDREAARNMVYNVYRLGNIKRTETFVAHTAVKESLAVDIIGSRSMQQSSDNEIDVHLPSTTNTLE